MMVTIMAMWNLLCLLALASMLIRLIRPVPLGASPDSFARALEAATPAVEHLLARTSLESDLSPLAAEAAEDHSPQGTPEEPPFVNRLAAADLSLADRLAIIRRMLQGMSVEETAVETGVPGASVRAIYHLHGREEAGKC